MSPEQVQDALECGGPEEIWKVSIAYLESRARQSREIARGLRRDAQDALEQADGHFAAAAEFDNLAFAMKNAPVTFPASAGEAGTAGTTKIGPAEGEHATREAGDAQNPAGEE